MLLLLWVISRRRGFAGCRSPFLQNCNAEVDAEVVTCEVVTCNAEVDAELQCRHRSCPDASASGVEVGFGDGG